MKWEDREESENVEDRRGIGAVGAVAGGGGILALVIYAAVMFLGGDPEQAKQAAEVVNKMAPPAQQQNTGIKRPTTPEEDRMAHFSKVVLKDTEVVWGKLFAQRGEKYPNPSLVLFTSSVATGCGNADSGVGPFYCPADQRIYIDLDFYNVMEKKLNAKGDFARAYVIAHEVGHHVQRLLNYSANADEARQRGSKTEALQASVRLELQADYFAGVWAHHGDKQFKFLEKGDLESAIHAAFEIGDDNLQMKARGNVRPDTFTHGSSEQRMKWFKEGYRTGDVDGAKQLFELPYRGL